MKKVLVSLFILVCLFVSCRRGDCSKGTPQCIKGKITDFDKTACDNGKVEEYVFQGQTVYLFETGNTCGADLTSEVTDENCVTLGYLGGIAGNTKINNEDFSHANFKRKIWSK